MMGLAQLTPAAECLAPKFVPTEDSKTAECLAPKFVPTEDSKTAECLAPKNLNN